MKFTITCKAFARLAAIPAFFEPSTDEDTKRQLSCVRIENYQGKVFAIATNQKVAAIEWIGNTTEPDGAVHIKVDPALVAQAEKEAPFESFMEIIYIPEILLATVKTMLGYLQPGNPASDLIPEQTVLAQWRKWLPPETIKKSKGAMYWGADHVALLAKSSPSGKVVFPEFIDTEKPILICDIENQNWLGVFIGKVSPSQDDPAPAQIPAWLK